MTDLPDKNIVPLPDASTRRRMILLGMVILIAGMVIGAAITTIITRRQSANRFVRSDFIHSRTIENLQKRLDLTDEQTEKIRPIFKKHIQALRDIQNQARPFIQEELKQMNEQIALQLTEEQKKQWENQIDRFQSKFRHRDRMRQPDGRYRTMDDPEKHRRRGEDRNFRRRRWDNRPPEPNENGKFLPPDPELEPDL